MFISSAAVLIKEFHVDGFRIDLTQAIHRDNHLEGAGFRAVPDANVFGVKFLREWCRTLKLLYPGVWLIAEDHTGWPAVVDVPDNGGLGFDATWYADFYHNLSGDTRHDGAAQLLRVAGFGDDRPLAMDKFANVLWESRNRHIVYHESHDEAGNSINGGTERTIRTSVQRAPLVGLTRRFAEARSRVVAALSILSPGTPMFLFGEEIGAAEDFKYNDVIAGKVDLWGYRSGVGKEMFNYYAALCRLRTGHAGFCTRNLDVLFCHNEHRLIAFHRWNDAGDDLLVIASLNNHPFNHGYVFQGLRVPDGNWHEIFNGDALDYGGDGIGNAGSTLNCRAGRFEAVIPANGVIVFQRV